VLELQLSWPHYGYLRGVLEMSNLRYRSPEPSEMQYPPNCVYIGG
jgi:hypothetical protein